MVAFVFQSEENYENKPTGECNTIPSAYTKYGYLG